MSVDTLQFVILPSAFAMPHGAFQALYYNLKECLTILKIERKATIRNRYKSSTIPDPEHPLGKCKKHKKTQHTREPTDWHFPSRGSQGCKKQTRQHNKDEPETYITKKTHKRSSSLEWSTK